LFGHRSDDSAGWHRRRPGHRGRHRRLTVERAEPTVDRAEPTVDRALVTVERAKPTVDRALVAIERAKDAGGARRLCNFGTLDGWMGM
ncbi:hypothetical protein SB717_36975, partial [Priestia sp. SIMBA_032]|uniref:hypothetical protein n=1 Tax=Priestia sp. SIMBA_032 TaxID=3085775 RepID=UPI00397D2CF1